MLGMTVALARAATYDENTAKDFMAYASAAYCAPARLQPDLAFNDDCAAQLSSFSLSKIFDPHADRNISDYNAHAHAYAVLGVDPAREWVVAAIKGTNETADMITDLSGGEFDFRDCVIGGNNFGKVHAGFCHYYEDLVADGMMEELIDLSNNYPTFSVAMTGHSLGAAVAVLAAYDFNLRTGKKVKITTFGLPRVGDWRFAKAFEAVSDEAFRVVHNRDIVAHLPPCCALLGSCKAMSMCPYHTITQIWYDNDMSAGSDYKVCDGGEDFSCQHEVSMSVDDHLMYFGVHLGSYCCF